MESKKIKSEEEALAVLDAIIAEMPSGDSSGQTVTDKESEERIKAACDVMKQITKGKEVRVSYELNTPYNGMGFITVVGSRIDISNPILFSKIMEISSNLEVYPKTNGDIQMNFTFHNLIRKAGN